MPEEKEENGSEQKPLPNPFFDYLKEDLRRPRMTGEDMVAVLAIKHPTIAHLYQAWQMGWLTWEEVLIQMLDVTCRLNEFQHKIIVGKIQDYVPPLHITVNRDQAAHINGNEDAGKYGTLSNFEKKLKKDEPWFAIRGQDKLAVPALEAYMKLMADTGLDRRDIASIGLLVDRIQRWQENNFTKYPD